MCSRREGRDVCRRCLTAACRAAIMAAPVAKSRPHACAQHPRWLPIRAVGTCTRESRYYARLWLNVGAMRHDMARRAIMGAATPTNTNVFLTPEGFTDCTVKRLLSGRNALLCLHSDQAVDRPDRKVSEDVITATLESAVGSNTTPRENRHRRHCFVLVFWLVWWY